MEITELGMKKVSAKWSEIVRKNDRRSRTKLKNQGIKQPDRKSEGKDIKTRKEEDKLM